MPRFQTFVHHRPMVRITIVGWIALGLGCTLTPADGMGGAFGDSDSGQPSEEPGGESSEGSEPAGDTSSDGGEESSSGGTFDPLDGSSGAGSEEGSGDGGSSGEASTGATSGATEEPGGAYAACETNDDCGLEPPGLACLSADENGAGGFCSPPCGTYGATPPDASLCPDPVGVAATVVCVEGLIRNCALSCQGDGDCPDGTACLMANGGGGPYCFGL